MDKGRRLDVVDGVPRRWLRDLMAAIQRLIEGGRGGSMVLTSSAAGLEG